MKPLLDAMKQYNRGIASWQRCEQYFERTDITIEEKETRVNDCRKLAFYLSDLQNKIKDLGYTMTEEERLQGFRQVEALNL